MSVQLRSYESVVFVKICRGRGVTGSHQEVEHHDTLPSLRLGEACARRVQGTRFLMNAHSHNSAASDASLIQVSKRLNTTLGRGASGGNSLRQHTVKQTKHGDNHTLSLSHTRKAR